MLIGVCETPAVVIPAFTAAMNSSALTAASGSNCNTPLTNNSFPVQSPKLSGISVRRSATKLPLKLLDKLLVPPALALILSLRLVRLL